MYNKTKTIYKQRKFLYTEAAIKKCSIDNYDQNRWKIHAKEFFF